MEMIMTIISMGIGVLAAHYAVYELPNLIRRILYKPGPTTIFEFDEKFYDTPRVYWEKK